MLEPILTDEQQELLKAERELLAEVRGLLVHGAAVAPATRMRTIGMNPAEMLAVSLMVHHDRDTALDWMKTTIANDDAPDWVRYLYPRYVLQIAPESPREGMVWAERIEDEGRREAAMVFVAQIWRGVDEDAAEAWLEQSSLSDLAKEKARSSLPDQPGN